jgi:hypothetical protein
MPAWEYGQLTITSDAHTDVQTRTILWQGPAASIEGALAEGGQTVLELLNQLGADGWELAGVEEDRQGGKRATDWGAIWSLVTYTFKRPVAS